MPKKTGMAVRSRRRIYCAMFCLFLLHFRPGAPPEAAGPLPAGSGHRRPFRGRPTEAVFYCLTHSHTFSLEKLEEA